MKVQTVISVKSLSRPAGGAIEKSTKVSRIHLRGTLMCEPNFTSINGVDVEILQSEVILTEKQVIYLLYYIKRP